VRHLSSTWRVGRVCAVFSLLAAPVVGCGGSSTDGSDGAGSPNAGGTGGAGAAGGSGGSAGAAVGGASALPDASAGGSGIGGAGGGLGGAAGSGGGAAAGGAGGSGGDSGSDGGDAATVGIDSGRDAGRDGGAGADGGRDGGADAGSDGAVRPDAAIDGGDAGGDGGDGGDGGGEDAGCTPEADAAFCARLGKACGRAVAADNCGATRTVGACGTCGGATPVCQSNHCVAAFSRCNGVAATCGSGGNESCCASISVPAGTFLMGRATENCGAVGCQTDAGNEGCPTTSFCLPNEQPEHSMAIGGFALDKYEVTVGRFRAFVAAYAGGWRPAAGAGSNPNVTVGDTSWQTAWDDSTGVDPKDFPAVGATAQETRDNFASRIECEPTDQTWTNAVGANENKPINCVDWYEAFAFCIWDGGRLPTEAEWEYAAAGGSENRLFAWGSAAPDCTHANFSNAGTRCGPGATTAISAVGAYPAGNGRWGHADLAGNVSEWNLDWFGDYSAAQNDNYANTAGGVLRVVRGGDFSFISDYMRTVFRYDGYADGRNVMIGFRCARTP
jgi:formylglycine-generating enzyme